MERTRTISGFRRDELGNYQVKIDQQVELKPSGKVEDLYWVFEYYFYEDIIRQPVEDRTFDRDDRYEIKWCDQSKVFYICTHTWESYNNEEAGQREALDLWKSFNEPDVDTPFPDC